MLRQYEPLRQIFTVSVGLGGEAASPLELHRSCEQAVIALSYRFYTGGNAVCAYAHISAEAAEAKLPPRLRELQQEWLLLVGCGSRSRALPLLDGMLEGLMTVRT